MPSRWFRSGLRYIWPFIPKVFYLVEDLHTQVLWQSHGLRFSGFRLDFHTEDSWLHLDSNPLTWNDLISYTKQKARFVGTTLHNNDETVPDVGSSHLPIFLPPVAAASTLHLASCSASFSSASYDDSSGGGREVLSSGTIKEVCVPDARQHNPAPWYSGNFGELWNPKGKLIYLFIYYFLMQAWRLWRKCCLWLCWRYGLVLSRAARNVWPLCWVMDSEKNGLK